MDAELKKLIEAYQGYNAGSDDSLLRRAYEFSTRCHAAQRRASQEPYFIHCLAVAHLLLDFKMDLSTVCAGLLHDVMEDASVTYDQLKTEFGEEVAQMVNGVTKLDRFQFTSTTEYQAENWRKMLIAMAKDMRVILIKLADRLHNMRTIGYLAKENQRRIAEESLTLYAPIAERLGMFNIKSELEDLSFFTLEPDLFHGISEQLDKQTARRQEYLKNFAGDISKKIEGRRIPFRHTFRPKHVYSIYQKMLRQEKELSQIEDTMGVRLITDTVANCYAILGEIQNHYKAAPQSFTDYIAQPKPNLYQSIHTSIYGPADQIVEIQIRTEEMHRRSEYGIAAHWKYKLGSAGKNRSDSDLEKNLNWLREWLQWIQELNNPSEFLEILKTELKVHQIFVFTPKMEVKALPEGATSVDFAYAVHTDIGNHCTGAKVNGKIVKLDARLASGDVCEVLVRKNAKPNEDWLKFVKTAKARSRIRHYLKEGSPEGGNRGQNVGKSKK
ncbi:MAG: bifunctional (p)ppGpp synthetase/guanosine-3',5'-bis(diphosphate) 3'-pyrophosphohydrolase [Elusimicrobia bacterium]|nr:bifunctional (p)ppGpp synthetase/guanosine-3',5'-bis(diphosphate) 3'-pyrophosphohydrolase [Elusimicrobiota bacterium]